MVDYFVVMILFLLNEGILGVCWCLMIAFNMVESANYGMAIFVMILFVVVKKMLTKSGVNTK